MYVLHSENSSPSMLSYTTVDATILNPSCQTLHAVILLNISPMLQKLFIPKELPWLFPKGLSYLQLP